jgi:hypothetical protein
MIKSGFRFHTLKLNPIKAIKMRINSIAINPLSILKLISNISDTNLFLK